ncbi:MAG: 4-vinyl reductase [Candidatus Calditenuis sp.]|jgi:predicted hydrocarbon binding protein|nr:4-vinyl reductase [Candidatus Calditenuis sp.]
MDFELPLFFYHQGRRLATVVLELRRPVSNLSKVLEALEKKSVSVLGLTSWLPGNDPESAGFLLAVDLTELSGGPSELIRALAEIREVTDVKVLESEIEGLTTVIQGGFATFLGERIYIMPSIVFQSIYLALYRSMGKSLFVILYFAGKAAGGRAAELRGLFVDVDAEPLSSLLSILKAIGPPLGILRNVELLRSENGEVLLLVEDLADCTTLRGVKTDMPTGHFLRGFIEGFLGSLGMDVEVYETMCVNLNHPHCAFELKTKSPT